MCKAFKGVALLIVNSAYKFIDNVGCALRDFTEIKRKFEICHYKIIFLENPTKEEIDDGIKQLTRLIYNEKYHEVVIFYAGRCIYSNLKNYMLLQMFGNPDVLEDHQLEDEGFSIEDLIRKVRMVKPPESDANIDHRAIVVIFDASREIIQSCMNIEPAFTINPIFPTRYKYELSHDACIGTLVCYPSERGSIAQCCKSGAHSVFVHYILNEVFQPEKSIIQAMGNVNQRVTHETKGAQKPYIDVDFPHFFTFSLKKNSLKKRNRLFKSRSSQNFTEGFALKPMVPVTKNFFAVSKFAPGSRI